MIGIRALLCGGVAAALAGIRPALAQSYPDRPIKLIVPFPPGGPVDVTARIIAQPLLSIIGQPFVIENRGGASRAIGAKLVAGAEPDGYTLLCGNISSLVVTPLFNRYRDYDPATAFTPVAKLTQNHEVLVVHPDFPANSVRELIAYAKANPGKLNYGTPGLGSSSHLTGEMLKLAAGIAMTHVPYGGLAPALTDLLAGHTDVMTANLDSVLAQVQEGKLRGLAVTSEKRAPEVPDLPAIAESYPEVVSTSWFAVVAPPKTPPEIAEKLSRAFAEILREPEVEKKWREMALTPVGGTPDEVGAFLKAETARWRHVIVSGGIKRQ